MRIRSTPRSSSGKMKNTQIKDLIRNVLKHKVSYLSIILIAALGVMSYLGIDSAAKSISTNVSNIYNGVNFRDIEVISTKLLSENDLKSLSGIEGVADTEPVRYTEVKASFGGVKENAGVISMTERINLPDVTDGRLPSSVAECAVEQKLADALGLKPGDKLTLSSSGEGGVRYLSVREFTVTGIIKHPDHVNGTVPETPYVLVDWDAFDNDALDGCFMRAEIIIKRDKNADRSGDAYKNEVAKVTERIDTIAVECTARRDNDIDVIYYGEVNENQALLDNAKKKLDDARKELDEKTKELKNAEKELYDAKKLLEIAKPELDEGQKKLDNALKQLEDGKKQLDSEKEKLDNAKEELLSAEKKLSSAKKELINGYKKIEDAKEEIRGAIRDAIEDVFKEKSEKLLIKWAKKKTVDPDNENVTATELWITESVKFDLTQTLEQILDEIENSNNAPAKLVVALYNAIYDADIPADGGGEGAAKIRQTIIDTVSGYADGYRQLSDGCKDWDEAHKQYAEGLKKYREGLQKYNDGERLYNEYEEKYNEGLSEYQTGLNEFEDKKAQYEQGLKDISDAEAKITEGRKLLDSGEAEYEKGLAEYNEGVSQIQEAIKQYEAIEPCKWYAFDIGGNTSYVQITIGASNIASLKMTFSMLFVIVGALVIFATVGKMIDEQRSTVGTQKALGFYRREIFAKYAGYGVSSTLIGVIAGIIGAQFGIYPMLLGNFNKYYIYDISTPRFYVVPALLSAAVGVCVALSAVCLACMKLLRQPASVLMQPKTPPENKGYGARKSFTLYSRLILRNIKTDIKRVAVTVVSIAGCCALIVVGFSLRSNVLKAPELQYGGLISYDLCVKFDPDSSDNAKGEIEDVLKAYNTGYTDVLIRNATYTITDIQVTEVICGDINEINGYRKLNNVDDGKPLFATNEGVLIQNRMAEIYGLDVNDEFDLTLGGTKTAMVRVAGVFENFIGRTVVLSRGYYETVYGEEPVSNSFLVRLNGADAEELISSLRCCESFESVSYSDEERSFVDTSMTVINTVVILFIFIAAVMAGVVQLNLTNIYILQKKPEMTVMRVNGFSTGQVVLYVLREVFVTTALGIALGIGIGSVMTVKILHSLEQPFIQFYRGSDFKSWLVGAAITLLFTVIVNAISLRKVKRLKLTDLTN